MGRAKGFPGKLFRLEFFAFFETSLGAPRSAQDYRGSLPLAGWGKMVVLAAATNKFPFHTRASGFDRPTFEQALQIDARVVSANTAGMVTVDAGLKAMATEAGPPVVLKGAVEGSTTRFMGDEHLAVIAPEGKAAPGLAEQVILTPPHCDPTVNLYESYHVVKGDTLVEIWPVTGRGRSR